MGVQITLIQYSLMISAQVVDATSTIPQFHPVVILPVLQTTNEGDLVLDLFCGSMTTGKVSQRFNRQFVGYDVQVY